MVQGALVMGNAKPKKQTVMFAARRLVILRRLWITYDDGFRRPFYTMLRWGFEEIEPLFPQNPALPIDSAIKYWTFSDAGKQAFGLLPSPTGEGIGFCWG